MNARRVVKVGGSLFRHPDLAVRLDQWLARQPPMVNVIVTGGGIWADRIRELERRGHCSPEEAHWLAIRAMGLTAWILAHALSDASHLDCFVALQRRLEQRRLEQRRLDSSASANLIFDPMSFLRRIEPQASGDRLPAGWDVTSDSIAARVAHVIHACELVLLKPVACAPTIALAQRCGQVDGYFARASRGLPLVRLERLASPPDVIPNERSSRL